MKEFIEKEKARLQAFFAPFIEGGLWIALVGPGRELFRLGLIYGYAVSRMAPSFDAGGKLKRIDFWFLFKEVGYDEGSQNTNIVRAICWFLEGTYLNNLMYNRSWRFHVELVFPDQEPDLADWRCWQRYNLDN